jgi:phosphonopyruvate decarboxylase
VIAGADALRWLASQRGDAIVVTTMTTARLWPAVSPCRELDLPISNCMGKASSVGLGLALARPDRDVWVLDGDGSLAMNLGSLLSVAQARPANLVHFVFQDGAYTTVGGSPVPGAASSDYAALARAAGYAAAAGFDDLAALQEALPGLLAGPRPLLIALRIGNWEGLGDFGPMTQQVMDDRLAAAADQFWAVRRTLTGQGPGRRPPA